MMIVAVLVFFPVVVNVTRGLDPVEPAALELMRSYAASDAAVLRKVRVPNALPYFFTALKVGTTLSLIGAIVGRVLRRLSDVLGRVIVQSASALRFDVTWAAIVHRGRDRDRACTWSIVGLERVVIPWHARRAVHGTIGRRPARHWSGCRVSTAEDGDRGGVAKDPRSPGAGGDAGILVAACSRAGGDGASAARSRVTASAARHRRGELRPRPS